MDIVEFLNARYDEDEAAARAADAEPAHPSGMPRATVVVHALGRAGMSLDYQAFAAVFDPARILVDIAAKRVLLDEIDAITITAEDDWPDPAPMDRPAGRMLRVLAAPYANHPDYDPAWTIEP